jgi:hypothetical protein
VPARSPLDLSEITPQYELFREEPTHEEPPVLPGDSGTAYCFALAPVRLGAGPDIWSTSTALVPAVLVCHDVNGYYRELGVHWQATRKQLAQAYMALGGMGSARLTYVFKQLLNPKTREAYDRTSAGETFLDDYTTDQLKRQAHQEARRRTTLGQSVTPADVMDEWGYAVLDDAEVDSVSPIRKDQSQLRKEPWGYSYYAWKTTSYSADENRLRQWQKLLSTAASLRGSAPRLAIGMTAVSDQPFMLGDVNGTPVVFFSETAYPDLSVAEKAIELFPASSPNPLESPKES